MAHFEYFECRINRKCTPSDCFLAILPAGNMFLFFWRFLGSNVLNNMFLINILCKNFPLDFSRYVFILWFACDFTYCTITLHTSL